MAELFEQPVQRQPTVIQDPRGGVRLSEPVDLRAVCLESSRRCGFPSLEAPLPVRAGQASWRRFTSAAPIADVAEVALALDDRLPRSTSVGSKSGIAAESAS